MDAKSVMSGLEGLTEYDWRTYHSDSEVRNIARDAIELLKEQPEVVRCSSCVFFHSGSCGLHSERMKPEGYCSWAVPKVSS